MIGPGSIPKDNFIHNIAALDATESPKIALSTVALKIGTHIRSHISTAPFASMQQNARLVEL
jgi:hypothetical protein